MEITCSRSCVFSSVCSASPKVAKKERKIQQCHFNGFHCHLVVSLHADSLGFICAGLEISVCEHHTWKSIQSPMYWGGGRTVDDCKDTHTHSSSRGGKRGGGVMAWFGIVGNVSTSLGCFSTVHRYIQLHLSCLSLSLPLQKRKISTFSHFTYINMTSHTHDGCVEYAFHFTFWVPPCGTQ